MSRALLLVFSLQQALLHAACERFASGSQCACDPDFWFDPRGDYCSPCPHTASCAGGSAIPVAIPGYFVTSTNPLSVVKCPGSITKCLGDSTCAVGYTGHLCNECAEGYAQYGAPTVYGEIQCEQCSGSLGCWHGLPVWVVALICTVVALLETLYVILALKKHRFLCFRTRQRADIRIIELNNDLYYLSCACNLTRVDQCNYWCFFVASCLK